MDQAVKEGWLTKKQRTSITSRGHLTIILSENEQRERAQAETAPETQRVGEGASEEGFEEIIKTDSKKES